MELLKSLLLDSLNGFSLKFLPLMILQLFVAALLGLIIEKIVNKKFGENILSNSALLAIVTCFIADIAKVSVAFSVLMGALLIGVIISMKVSSVMKSIGLFIVLAVALACGIGSVVQAILGTVFILMVIFFTPLKEE